MSTDTVCVNACDNPVTWVRVLEAGLWLTLRMSRMKREKKGKKGGAKQLWEEEEPVDTGQPVPTSDAISVGSHL